MRATIINRDYWWSGGGDSSTKATVGIDGLEEQDLVFLVEFLNTPDAITRIRSLRRIENRPAIVVDSLKDVGVQEERLKLKLKDDKKYETPQVGTIDSLEL